VASLHRRRTDQCPAIPIDPNGSEDRHIREAQGCTMTRGCPRVPNIKVTHVAIKYHLGTTRRNFIVRRNFIARSGSGAYSGLHGRSRVVRRSLPARVRGERAGRRRG
jgi:hypothetical protein